MRILKTHETPQENREERSEHFKEKNTHEQREDVSRETNQKERPRKRTPAENNEGE